MSKRVTIDDLQDGQAYGLLLCSTCGQETSADRRDYFWASAGYVFTCCKRNMSLVRKVTTYVPVLH